MQTNMIIKLSLLIANRYRFYSRSQYWDTARIQEYQNKRLIRTIQSAYKEVPYYKELFTSIGFNPDQFLGTRDIAKIPLLDKDVLRKQYQMLVSNNAAKYGMQWEKTSGSTGTPLNILHDNNCLANKSAATFRAFRWTGYRFGQWLFSIAGVSPDQPTVYSIDKMMRRINLYSNQVTQENCISIGKIVNRLRPQIYMGYGNSFLMMGKFLKDQGISINPPHAIINYGENLSLSIIGQLQSLYNTKVFDYYSHTENCVLIHQCEYGSMHIAEDYSFHELIDDKGNPIEKGEGELVGTTFYSQGMPLIRYKTRDYAVLCKKRCKCGRKSRVVEEILGRKDDYIITPDGKYLFLPEGAISFASNVITSQYIQDTKDHLTVKIVVDSGFQDVEKDKILIGLRQRFGNVIKIDIEVVEELEKTRAGKTPFIISNIGNKYESL